MLLVRRCRILLQRASAQAAPLYKIAFFTASAAARGIEEFFPTVLQLKEGQVPPKAGRAWTAAELRLKSFDDLHKLWFVCLKERNMLLSDRLYHKQVGQAAPDGNRLHSVKKTMAMIKVVLGERRRAATAYTEAAAAEALADAAEAAGAVSSATATSAAPRARLVSPTPADAVTLSAKAAAAAAVKQRYSGAMVTIKKFGRKITLPAESDAALKPTRQARRVEQKRRRFLTEQRRLRKELETVEASTHGAAAVEAQRQAAIARPPMRMRAPNSLPPKPTKPTLEQRAASSSDSPPSADAQP